MCKSVDTLGLAFNLFALKKLSCEQFGGSRRVYIPTFTAALSIAARRQEQSECPSKTGMGKQCGLSIQWNIRHKKE